VAFFVYLARKTTGLAKIAAELERSKAYFRALIEDASVIKEPASSAIPA
jgi:hypothetical protein